MAFGDVHVGWWTRSLIPKTWPEVPSEYAMAAYWTCIEMVRQAGWDSSAAVYGPIRLRVDIKLRDVANSAWSELPAAIAQLFEVMGLDPESVFKVEIRLLLHILARMNELAEFVVWKSADRSLESDVLVEDPSLIFHVAAGPVLLMEIVLLERGDLETVHHMAAWRNRESNARMVEPTVVELQFSK